MNNPSLLSKGPGRSFSRSSCVLVLSMACVLSAGCLALDLDDPDLLALDEELGTSQRSLVAGIGDWRNDDEIIDAFRPEWRFSSSHVCWPLVVANGETGTNTCRSSFEPGFTVFAKVIRRNQTDLKTMRIAYAVAYGYQDPPGVFGSHGEDVEMVVVDIVNGELTSVRYNVHAGAYVKMASKLEVVDGTRPVVYVGANYHASYSDTETDASCLLGVHCNFGDVRGNDHRSSGKAVNLADIPAGASGSLAEVAWHWPSPIGNRTELNNPYGLVGCDSGNTDGGEICVRSDLDDTNASPGTWDTSRGSFHLAGEAVGGPHGKQFNDIRVMDSPSRRLAIIAMRSGERVDAIQLRYDNGATLNHGGSGGSYRDLSLAINEHIQYVIACSGKHDGTTRVFFLQVGTNLGRSIHGGTYTSSCRVWTSHAPHRIITGFYGRSGAELDLIGPIYKTEDAACFYDGPSYSGASWCYGPGYSAGLTTGNDKASSALVFGNVQVLAYEHYYYSGAMRLITRSITDFFSELGAFDNVLSSFRMCTKASASCY